MSVSLLKSPERIKLTRIQKVLKTSLVQVWPQRSIILANFVPSFTKKSIAFCTFCLKMIALFDHTFFTQMEFSPSGEYLLTVSRDRNWCLYKEEKEEGGWNLVGRTQKNNSVHQRLLWTCSWSADSKYFATGSRDKKVALWSVGTPYQEEVNQTSLGVCQ